MFLHQKHKPHFTRLFDTSLKHHINTQVYISSVYPLQKVSRCSFFFFPPKFFFLLHNQMLRASSATIWPEPVGRSPCHRFIFPFESVGNSLVCNFSHRQSGAADFSTLRVLGVLSIARFSALLPCVLFTILTSYLDALKCSFFVLFCFIRRGDDDGTVLCFLFYTFVLLPVVRSNGGTCTPLFSGPWTVQ